MADELPPKETRHMAGHKTLPSPLPILVKTDPAKRRNKLFPMEFRLAEDGADFGELHPRLPSRKSTVFIPGTRVGMGFAASGRQTRPSALSAACTAGRAATRLVGLQQRPGRQVDRQVI